MRVVFDTSIYVSAFILPGSRAGLAILKVIDGADNRILECAVAGKAEAILTGDKAMLELKAFEGIRMLSLKAYLGMP